MRFSIRTSSLYLSFPATLLALSRDLQSCDKNKTPDINDAEPSVCSTTTETIKSTQYIYETCTSTAFPSDANTVTKSTVHLDITVVKDYKPPAPPLAGMKLEAEIVRPPFSLCTLLRFRIPSNDYKSQSLVSLCSHSRCKSLEDHSHSLALPPCSPDKLPFPSPLPSFIKSYSTSTPLTSPHSSQKPTASITTTQAQHPRTAMRLTTRKPIKRPSSFSRNAQFLITPHTSQRMALRIPQRQVPPSSETPPRQYRPNPRQVAPSANKTTRLLRRLRPRRMLLLLRGSKTNSICPRSPLVHQVQVRQRHLHRAKVRLPGTACQKLWAWVDWCLGLWLWGCLCEGLDGWKGKGGEWRKVLVVEVELGEESERLGIRGVKVRERA